MKHRYILYTDGSSKGNGREGANGGWAYAVIDSSYNFIRTESGYAYNTTNNAMELTALLKGLQYLDTMDRGLNEPLYFDIYTDSAYIYNCYKDEWYKKWQSNGWVTSNKTPVKNIDLWKQIIPYFKEQNYSFHKVRGHSGVGYNELVDKLACEAATTGHGKTTGRGEISEGGTDIYDD